MRYIKALTAIVFVFMLMATAINAMQFNDYILSGYQPPVYTGEVIDGSKVMANPANAQITKEEPKALSDLKNYNLNAFQNIANLYPTLEVHNLKVSPSTIVGESVLTVDYDVINKENSDLVNVLTYINIAELNSIYKQKDLGTIIKGEIRHVQFLIAMPSCKDSASYKIKADTGFRYSIGGKIHSGTSQEKSFNYIPKSECSQPTTQDVKATIKFNPANPAIGEQVAFSAEITQGTENGPFQYNWDFENDGTFDSTQASPNNAYSTAGDKTVKLSIVDKAGKKYVFTSTISVKQAQTVEPVFTITISPENPKVNENVVFNIQFTQGANGNYQYLWDFNNDGNVDATSKSPSNAFAAAGSYTAKLTVLFDGKQKSATKEFTVTNPQQVNTAPTADFTFSPSNPKVGDNIQFTGSASDKENDQLTYSWDFYNDGSVEYTTKDVTVKADKVETVNVAFTVNDGKEKTVVLKTVVITAADGSNGNGNTQTEDDKYNTLENDFEDLEDDYSEFKSDYEDALKANDEDELEDIKDDLDDLYKDVKDLLNKINDFQDIVQDNDVEDDLDDLEKEVKDLKQNVLDLKNGNMDDELLYGTSSSSEPIQQPQPVFVPQQQPQQQPQSQIEVLTTPTIPTPVMQPIAQPGNDNTAKIALFIGGIIILLALIVFMVAIVVRKF